jgi:hypothetical protein
MSGLRSVSAAQPAQATCMQPPSVLQTIACMHARSLSTTQETGDSDDGVDEDEDADEEEEELLAAATDLLPALATAMGPAAYAPVFASLHAEPLLSRLRPQSALPLRALAAGGIAEVANVLGHHASALAPVALPLLLRELQSDVSVGAPNRAPIRPQTHQPSVRDVSMSQSVLIAIVAPCCAYERVLV